jgi:hypothetical protein
MKEEPGGKLDNLPYMADDESGNGESGTSGSATTSIGQQSRSDELVDIAKMESDQIYWLRVLLGFVLFAATVAAAAVIFRVTDQGEDERFDTRYHDNAFKIADSFEARLRHTIAAIDNYALVSSTQQDDDIDNWPLVTARKFEVRGASSRSLAGAGLLTVLPLVTPEHRAAWENYSVNNTGWVQEGLLFNATNQSYHLDIKLQDEEHDEEQENHDDEELQDSHVKMPANFSQGIANTIFVIDEHTHEAIVDDSGGPYFPVWQTTPVHEKMVNYNILSHGSFGNDMMEAVKSVKIVFGSVADV